MRTALAVFIALLAAAPAQAAGTKVTWPEGREYAPGDQIAVTVKGDREVKVAVVRVSSSGKPMSAVKRRTFKRGTLKATLARAGTYEVRVGRRERTLKVVAPAPPPPAATPLPCPAATTLEVTLGTDRVTRGENLPYTIKNLSDACVSLGLGYALEYHEGDGAWKPVPWPLAFPAMAVFVQPGGVVPSSVQIPADAPLGTYRMLGLGSFAEPTFTVVA